MGSSRAVKALSFGPHLRSRISTAPFIICVVSIHVEQVWALNLSCEHSSDIRDEEFTLASSGKISHATFTLTTFG